MRILVTGSSGFIARFLIPELAARGHEVVGIDRRPGIAFEPRFRFVQTDILDSGAVGGAMRGIDLVVHLAAEHKDFGVPATLYRQVNVEGTETLLRCATECGVGKFVFFSSVAVYGDSAVPTHEELSPSASSPYGSTKLLAEQRVRAWAEGDRGREVVMLRPTVVFGPHNRANMYRLIDAVARRRYFSVGSGENIKSVAYVENLAAAAVFAVERMAPGVQLYNYADSPHLTTRELVRCIAETLRVSVPFMRIPRPVALACALPFDLVARVTGADLPLTAKRIEKFTMATHHLAEKIRGRGYAPPHELEEGIRRTVAWYLAGRSGREGQLSS
jgi:GlcNAc-P-P-Und epimerase